MSGHIIANIRTHDRSRSQDTRTLLITKALELFLANGYRQTSLQQIVEAAGLTKGAFYHHFSSKDDVLLIAHETYLDSQMEVFERVLAEHLTSSERVERVILGMLEGVQAHRSELSLFLEERRSLQGPKFDSVRRKRREFEIAFMQLMADGITAGEFDLDPEDARHAALSLIGMISWTYQWLKDDKSAVRDVAGLMSSMVINGLVRIHAPTISREG